MQGAKPQFLEPPYNSNHRSQKNASKHFYLERGVRQGCPLSSTLFVIAIELLAQSIRRPKEIKGITIGEHKEVKLLQYADDTTVLLSDV